MAYDENRRPILAFDDYNDERKSSTRMAREGRYNTERTSYPSYMDRFEKATHKKQMDDMYQGEPPYNYTCNRCDKKGHYLQACPTNLDPSYDKPPGPTYVCEICQRQGHHFKSLCPLNQDPYSIIQKRIAIGIVENPHTPTKAQFNILDQWERDTEKKRESDEMDLGRPSESKKRARLEKGDVFSSSPSREWKTNGEGLQDVSNGRVREREYEAEDIPMGGVGHGKTEKFKENKRPRPGYGSIFAPDNLPIRSRPKTDYEIELNDSEGDGGKNGDRKEDEKDSAPVISPFILGLMAKHPEMSERVNAAPKRRTAMEIWDDPEVTKSFDWRLWFLNLS